MILHHMYMNDKNNVTIILPDKFFVGGKKGRDYIGNSNCGCTLLNIYTYSGFTYMIIFSTVPCVLCQRYIESKKSESVQFLPNALIL